MLAAGSLDRRVRLERATSQANAFNEPVQTWTPIATVWASKKDVSDRERLASAQVGASLTTRFQIRWSSLVADLNSKDRLVCEGRTYEIAAVRELGRREGLEISATARAD